MKFLCPLCAEKGIKTEMKKVGSDTYYIFAQCPVCGNEAMIEKIKEG